jgi:hypothetical protein
MFTHFNTEECISRPKKFTSTSPIEKVKKKSNNTYNILLKNIYTTTITSPLEFEINVMSTIIQYVSTFKGHGLFKYHTSIG